MSKKANLYVGHAGQMAVISEFLIRGWNVGLFRISRGTRRYFLTKPVSVGARFSYYVISEYIGISGVLHQLPALRLVVKQTER